MYWIAFIAGVLSLFVQVALFREMFAFFFTNELILGMLYGLWLLSSGLGSILYKGKKTKLLFLLLLFIFLLSIPYFKLLVIIFSPGIGQIFPLSRVILVIFLVSFPISFIDGMLIASIFSHKRISPARVYLFDAVGSLVGGGLSLVLSGVIPAFSQVALLGAVSILLLIILGKLERWHTVLAVLLLLFSPFAGKLSVSLDKIYWRGYDIAVSETRYGKVTVLNQSGEYSLYENGRFVSVSTDKTAPEVLAHLAGLSARNVNSICQIGGLFSGVPAELEKYHPERYIIYEQDKGLVRFGSGFFTIKQERVIFKDGFYGLKRSNDRFDIVLLFASNPTTGEVNRFFTREFFSIVHKHLRRGGTFEFALTFSENYLTNEEKFLLSSIHKTASSVFPSVIIVPYFSTYIFLCFPEEVDVDGLVSRVRENFHRIDGRTRFFSAAGIDYILDRTRIAEVKDLIVPSPINSIAAPVAYLFGILKWERLSGGAILRPAVRLRPNTLIAGLILLSILALILGRIISGKDFRAFWAIFLLGLSGISFELLLLYLFQSSFGSLYWLVGLLSSGFMVGLVIGNRLFTKLGLKLHGVLLSLVLATIILVLARLSLPVLIALPPTFLSVLVYLVLIIAFAIPVGGVFVSSAEYFSGLGMTAFGRLYGFDLIGSAIGSLFFGVLVLPILGAGNSLFALTGMLAVSILFFF